MLVCYRVRNCADNRIGELMGKVSAGLAAGGSVVQFYGATGGVTTLTGRD